MLVKTALKFLACSMKQTFYPLHKPNIARAWQQENTFFSIQVFPFGPWLSGAAPREGLGGTVSPLLSEVIFVNRAKPMRK